MKYYLALGFSLFYLSFLVAQVDDSQLIGVNIMKARTDTSIRVYYTEENTAKLSPAYYLDGELTTESVLRSINPLGIEDLKVVAEDFVINDQTFHGKIEVTTKASYTPVFISLSALRDKYLKVDDIPYVFLLNGQLVHADYDSFLIDEGYVLKILVESFEQPATKLHFTYINVLLRTEENIRKDSEIRLRGTVATKE